MNATVILLGIIVAMAVGVGVYLVTKRSNVQAAPVATPVGPDVGWQAAGVIAQGTAATVGAVIAAFL